MDDEPPDSNNRHYESSLDASLDIQDPLDPNPAKIFSRLMKDKGALLELQGYNSPHISRVSRLLRGITNYFIPSQQTEDFYKKRIEQLDHLVETTGIERARKTLSLKTSNGNGKGLC